MRGRRRLPACLFFLVTLAFGALAVPLPLEAACDPLPGSTDEWRLESHDLDSLYDELNNPQLVRFDAGRASAGEGAYESVAHMHVLVDAGVDALADVLTDVERQPEFMPRLAHAEVRCSDLQEEGFLRLEQELSFRFLIFRRDYRYVIDYHIEDDIAESGSFRVWWVLYDRGDGQIVKNTGSWYVKGVEIDGREYSYVAYAVHTVFARRQAGLPLALRRFGERDFRNTMVALYEEAHRRES